MPTLFSKLNLKDQREILVLEAPASLDPELKGLRDVNILRDLKSTREVSFALVFVQRQAELDRLSAAIAKRAGGDAVLWFAYPKGTSKKLTCEFNRDKGWDVLREAGFDTVRQVSIDEDWSALRFRRIEFIKR